MCPLLLLMMVVMVVVVESASPGVSHHRHHHEAVNQQEVLLAITLNQMALLHEMNTSSSVCASRDSELRELRLLKEATMEQLEEMKQEARQELEALRETMVTEVKDLVLEDIRSASLVQPSQQPSHQPSEQPSQQPPPHTSQEPDLSDLDALHNDTNPSLCGPNKVLIGGRGSLSPSHPQNYTSHKYCIWQVILPEGTRPVFTWDYIQMEQCGNCLCDWVAVPVPGVAELPRMCGDSTVTATHPMYSIMGNRFTVIFRSDGSVHGKGFVLRYAAERVP